MRCTNCGSEFDDSLEKCPNCNSSRNVTILSPEERENFRGMTISQEEEKREDGYYEYNHTGPGHRVHIRQVRFDSSRHGFWGKFAVGLAVLAIIAGLFLVALPIVLFFIIGIGVVSFVLKLLRGR